MRRLLLPLLLLTAPAAAQEPGRFACPPGGECHVVCATPAQPDYEVGAVERAEFLTLELPGGVRVAALRVTLRGGSAITFTGPELRCRLSGLTPAP
ncbi:hypothetical protein ACI6QG_05690 [Roseococcus sp. DSY-14]|uniref:hypothetical protein n=1 Tax=Roseococcus sp. DSY-14 TaxID=3369650 RepID=UPI00387ACC02